MNSPSSLGGNLSINVEEFINLARTYFYTNEGLFGDLRAIFTAFNLSLSQLYSYQVYLKGFEDFILSLGKTRMRENLRHRELVLDNKTFSTSLFNLVTPQALSDAEVKNPGFLSTT
jgi:hypothetical protein